jgi:hypothetical protein
VLNVIGALFLQVSGTGSSEPSAAVTIGLLLVSLLAIVCFWVIFSKAGEPGWYSIIPIWSTIVLLRIVGRPWWWIILLLIPFLNIIFYIIVDIDLGKAFGHGPLFSILLLILLPFVGWLILAFGDSPYQGKPAGSG